MRINLRRGCVVAVLLAGGAAEPAEDGKRLLPDIAAREVSPKNAGTDARIAWLEKAVAREPRNVALENQLAGAYLQKVRETVDFGYLDRAEKILARVLESDDGNYEALRMREVADMEWHHFHAAAELSGTLISLHPGDAWNYGILGDASMEMGDYERAGAAYQKMMALRVDQSSLNRASWHEFVSGRPRQAIGMMQQAIDAGAQSPENTAWCLVDLGNLYFKTGAIEAAAASYRRARETFPGYHAAHAGMGRALAAQGKYAEAIEEYRKAQGSVPLPDYAAALEQLYTLTSKPEEARKQRELIDFVDRMARAAAEKTNRNLAIIYADQGRNLDRALELVEAEFKERGDVYTYDAEAWVLFQRKDYERAEQAARKAVRLGTPEPGFYYHAGRIAAAVGNKDDARRWLGRALELNPKFDLGQGAVAAEMLKGL